MMVRILALVWDDQREEHVARHGVSTAEVDELITDHYVLIRNRGSRSATHLLVGRTAAGRVLTAAVSETPDAGIWRLYTAYPSTENQRELFVRAAWR